MLKNQPVAARLYMFRQNPMRGEEDGDFNVQVRQFRGFERRETRIMKSRLAGKFSDRTRYPLFGGKRSNATPQVSVFGEGHENAMRGFSGMGPFRHFETPAGQPFFHRPAGDPQEFPPPFRFRHRAAAGFNERTNPATPDSNSSR